ncbi:hypothetical protein S7711_03718 [Stachybotrys chartarum IBT 7711]|uniref:Zn(2)-C6 fungal-type domain-containing protein n=1 Tax=Stachybotrys chartarum (strain CBS 109288 / IBT 7711) TaxID=1280523 RepID=A0A084AWQ8_STACB|nr:hypothetical protein S7711_03718 [Stachybotrys chartarum IBT 7711]
MEPDPDSSPNGSFPGFRPAPQKRSRIVLSCGPCRVSKLKCDRGQPCSQCQKKARVDLCLYAPKPERKRPAKGMAARVKRLEGMVRDMLDTPPPGPPPGKKGRLNGTPELLGQVVQNDHVPTYVGATHCLAMLEDIQDIKSYFEEADDEDEISTSTFTEDTDTPEIIINARGGPKNRDELLACLPERKIVDRIIMRYFESSSPSQRERPSANPVWSVMLNINRRDASTEFRTDELTGDKYTHFWQNPHDVPMHWIAQLFMMVALGILFSIFSAPHELEDDSPLPVMERMKEYRDCAGLALTWGKYTQPTMATLPAFLLYVESLFMFNRATQMPCYILSGVCIRLMLKMGLHRDPSKLANISVFEGEMRRRTWNMAIQIELLVSFHMGLPSMVQGVESDTAPPRNLQDEDFDEDSTELPPARPSSDWTSILYPIHKTQILRVFGKIGQQSHALSPPNYNDVLALDKQLQQVWGNVPSYLKVRPLDDCIGEPPILLVQRFGLGALYDKSRCVLHRRYLDEPVSKPEHDFSRRQCLEGALTLLRNQYVIWQACKPNGHLNQAGWFVSSLSIHDYLLAAVVVYVVIQSERYVPGGDWVQDMTGLPTKEELKDLIKNSYFVWLDVSRGMRELRKTADTLAVMLSKIGYSIDGSISDPNTSGDEGITSSSSTSPLDNLSSGQTSSVDSVGSTGSVGSYPPELASLATFDLNGPDFVAEKSPFALNHPSDATPIMDMNGLGMSADAFNSLEIDQSWFAGGDNMDWRHLDNALANSYYSMNPEFGQTFAARVPQQNDLGVISEPWSQFTSMANNGY